MLYNAIMSNPEMRQRWPEFSLSQKIAAVAVNAITLSRPVLMGAAAHRRRGQETLTATDAALVGAAYLTDLEGNLARRTNTQTAMGEILDRTVDRVTTNMLEATLVSEGRESPKRYGLRLARTLAITGLRHYIRTRTDSPDFTSHPMTRPSSAFRQGVNVFAASPLGDKYPKVRSGLQTLATATTVVSGIADAKKLMDNNIRR